MLAEYNNTYTHLVLGSLLFFTSLIMIFLVLIQRGRGGGLAGALGGSGGTSAFGAKAGDTFTKLTSSLAIFWFVLCILTVLIIQGPIERTADSDDQNPSISETEKKEGESDSGETGSGSTAPGTADPGTTDPAKTDDPAKTGEANEGDKKAEADKPAADADKKDGENDKTGDAKTGAPAKKSDAAAKTDEKSVEKSEEKKDDGKKEEKKEEAKK